MKFCIVLIFLVSLSWQFDLKKYVENYPGISENCAYAFDMYNSELVKCGNDVMTKYRMIFAEDYFNLDVKQAEKHFCSYLDEYATCFPLLKVIN